jgi:dimethylargininase
MVLEQLGLDLIRLEPDDRFPDCCFVEDTATVVGDSAIISRMAAGSRVGEEVEVRKVLARDRQIHEIEPPGMIDGGDVIIIDDKIYIGLGARTNRSAIEQVNQILSGKGYEVVPVDLENILHLKSACSYIGSGWIVLLPGHFDTSIFGAYEPVLVPEGEAYSANCLAINGKVLVSRGYGETKRLIEEAGFETVDLEMSEFRKGQGSLTCLSKTL